MRLLVFPSKSQQRLAAGLLKAVGMEIALANNGQEALSWLKDHWQPDLILMDIVMLDINGFDLCRKIRTELALKDVPIIFCSEKSQDFDRFWALLQGGNGYLTKPYSPRDLVEKVKENIA